MGRFRTRKTPCLRNVYAIENTFSFNGNAFSLTYGPFRYSENALPYNANASYLPLRAILSAKGRAAKPPHQIAIAKSGSDSYGKGPVA